MLSHKDNLIIDKMLKIQRELNLKDYEFADMIGVSRQYFSDWRHRKRPVGTRLLKRIVAATNKPESYFFEQDKQQRQPICQQSTPKEDAAMFENFKYIIEYQKQEIESLRSRLAKYEKDIERPTTTKKGVMPGR